LKNDFYDICLPHLSTKDLRRCQHLDSEFVVDGIAAAECGIDAVVGAVSSKRQRKAVEVTSRYFRREFRNQVVPYNTKAFSVPDEHRAYLWIDRHEYVWHRHKKVYPVIGACCFRLRGYKGPLPPDVPAKSYILEWLWFHPYERRRGHFSKALPYFLARFPRLITDHPVSPETAALLKGHGIHPYEPAEREVLAVNPKADRNIDSKIFASFECGDGAPYTNRRKPLFR
jgi:hypothetical protein